MAYLKVRVSVPILESSKFLKFLGEIHTVSLPITQCTSHMRKDPHTSTNLNNFFLPMWRHLSVISGKPYTFSLFFLSITIILTILT